MSGKKIVKFVHMSSVGRELVILFTSRPIFWWNHSKHATIKVGALKIDFTKITMWKNYKICLTQKFLDFWTVLVIDRFDFTKFSQSLRKFHKYTFSIFCEINTFITILNDTVPMMFLRNNFQVTPNLQIPIS